jgi:hypothetical protein
MVCGFNHLGELSTTQLRLIFKRNHKLYFPTLVFVPNNFVQTLGINFPKFLSIYCSTANYEIIPYYNLEMFKQIMEMFKQMPTMRLFWFKVSLISQF